MNKSVISTYGLKYDAPCHETPPQILHFLSVSSAGTNELDAYCRFIPNTSKALPITPEKKLFGTRGRS